VVVSTVIESTPQYLVACPACHAQFDPTGLRGDSFLCHCGTRVVNTRPTAVDAPVRRCSACGAGVEAGAETCGYCGSSVGAGAGRLICPECFARNQGQARFCAGCGVEFRPQPVLAAGDPVPCPVCKTDLSPRSLAGLAIQECGTCHGLWAPAASFDALVAQAGKHTQPPATEGLHAPTRARPQPPAPVTYRSCPVCRQAMNRKNFARISGIVVDWCRGHGTWLDADELAQIAAFVAKGGMQQLAEREKEEARIAASMRLIHDLGETQPASDERPTSLVDVLTTIFS